MIWLVLAGVAIDTLVTRSMIRRLQRRVEAIEETT